SASARRPPRQPKGTLARGLPVERLASVGPLLHGHGLAWSAARARQHEPGMIALERFGPQLVDENLHGRLARELVSNFVRPASARTMRVELRCTDGEVVLVVADDGVGFDADTSSERLSEGHIGLPSQRVRIESAGGRLEIQSKPGEGTRVEARVPA